MSATEQKPQTEAADEAVAEKPRPGISGKIKLLGLLVGLIALEVGVAWFLLPGAAEPASQAAAAPAASHGEKSKPHAEPAAKSHGKAEGGKKASGHSAPASHGASSSHGASTGHGALPASVPPASPDELFEVDLGQFAVSAYQPASATTLRMDFHLWGTLKGGEAEEFQEAWTRNNNRLRDQIISIVRSAEISDLTDAGLGLIKRQILEKTNRTLGKPYLHNVIFSEFSFMEQ